MLPNAITPMLTCICLVVSPPGHPPFNCILAGQLPRLGPPQVYCDRVDHRFSSALNAAKMIMAGRLLRVSTHCCLHGAISTSPGLPVLSTALPLTRLWPCQVCVCTCSTVYACHLEQRAPELVVGVCVRLFNRLQPPSGRGAGRAGWLPGPPRPAAAAVEGGAVLCGEQVAWRWVRS